MRPQLDDLLLPGEDPVRIQDGDVAMWVSVYEELLVGHRRILEEMRSNGSSRQIELHIQRLELGLAFWTRQLHRGDSPEVPLRLDISPSSSIMEIVTVPR
jgi:hypothetical protein